MRFPKSPDLGSPGRVALTVLAVAIVVGAILGVETWSNLDATLGDTDDATRLVLVRMLLDGQGWWAQHLMRFQPPVGVYMHWSELLTGGIAALNWLFRLGLSADDAELATRFLWPLLWIFPASVAALMLARRLGGGLMGGAAVLVCAIILATDMSLYVQFRPGRIDHHDVQMTLCFLSLAGASMPAPNVRGALLAGIATGIGIAIGLEALIFEAVIGAGIALRFAFQPAERRAAQAYGLSLVAATALAFAVQTPPWRWSLVACDEVAPNLVAAVAVAGLGLALAAELTAKRDPRVRVLVLAGLGALAALTYLGLDPNCAKGPFADVDPRIKPIWLNYVQEIRPIGKVWKRDRAEAISMVTPWAVSLICWIGIGFRAERRRRAAWLIGGACLVMGVVAAASAIRMTGYAEWFGVPMIAAAAVEAARRYEKAGIVAVVLAGAVATPTVATGVVLAASGQGKVHLFPHRKTSGATQGANAMHGGAPAPKRMLAKTAPKPPAKPAPDRCFDTDSFDVLDDATPPGLVLSEVDMGPFILANTDDSALSGPYHRMSWGILKARSIYQAPADGAAADLARQTGITYVLECRGHWKHGDHDGMGPQSLQKRLDAGKPPAWLQPLSPKDAALQVYRVLPVVAAPPTPAPTASKAEPQDKAADARS